MQRAKTVVILGAVGGLVALGLCSGGGPATPLQPRAGRDAAAATALGVRASEGPARDATRKLVLPRPWTGQRFDYEARLVQRADGAEVVTTRQRISGELVSTELDGERVVQLWLRDPQVVLSHGGQADAEGARSLGSALAAGLEFRLDEDGRVTAYRSSEPLSSHSAILVREVVRSLLHEVPERDAGHGPWTESHPYRLARWSAARETGVEGAERIGLHRKEVELIDPEGRRLVPSRQSGHERRSMVAARSLPVRWSLRTEMTLELGFGTLESSVVGSMDAPRPVAGCGGRRVSSGSWTELDSLSLEPAPSGPLGDIAEVANAVCLADCREQRILVARDLLRRLRHAPADALELRELVLDPSLELEIFDLLLEVLARVGGEEASVVLAEALGRTGFEPLRRQLLLKNLSVCEDARDVLVQAVQCQLRAGEERTGGMAMLALGSLSRSNELGGELLDAARPDDADPALMTWVLARANGRPDAARAAGRSVIDHRDPGVREAAVEALGKASSAADLEILRRVAASDPESSVRGLAIRIVARSLDADGLESWATALLARESAPMRGQLARGLQERSASDVVERLLDLLRRDPALEVRELIG